MQLVTMRTVSSAHAKKHDYNKPVVDADHGSLVGICFCVAVVSP